MVEHLLVHQKVIGSISSQGTYLGCGINPHLGCTWKATNRCFPLTSIFLSSSLSTPLLLSLKSINVSLGEDYKGNKKRMKGVMEGGREGQRLKKRKRKKGEELIWNGKWKISSTNLLGSSLTAHLPIRTSLASKPVFSESKRILQVSLRQK